VFVMSLVLLWDAWNKHTGAPPLFGSATPRPSATASAPPPQASAAPGTAAVPSATTSTPTAPAATVSAVPGAAPAPGGELITLTTNQVKATIDTRGGELVRLELLHYIDNVDRTHNVVLFDRSGARLYLARSGLATVDNNTSPW